MIRIGITNYDNRNQLEQELLQASIIQFERTPQLQAVNGEYSNHADKHAMHEPWTGHKAYVMGAI